MKNSFKNIFFILVTYFFITSINADEKMALGLEVYNNKAMCGTCHTLENAGSVGNIGPNLDAISAVLYRISPSSTDRNPFIVDRLSGNLAIFYFHLECSRALTLSFL